MNTNARFKQVFGGGAVIGLSADFRALWDLTELFCCSRKTGVLKKVERDVAYGIYNRI